MIPTGNHVGVGFNSAGFAMSAIGRVYLRTRTFRLAVGMSLRGQGT